MIWLSVLIRVLSYYITIIYDSQTKFSIIYIQTNTCSEIHHRMTNCKEIEELDKK